MNKDQIAMSTDMLEFISRLGLQKIGDYEFHTELGGGKAALTCLYKTCEGERLVFKFLVMPRHDEEVIKFKMEAEVLEELAKHKAFVPRLRRSFQHHAPLPVYSFAMEFVDGKSLDMLLESRPTPWHWKEALRLLHRLSFALATGHRYVCHRDLHPGNFLIAETEVREVGLGYSDPGVRILDFGAHKHLLKNLFGMWSEDPWRLVGGVSCWSPEYLKDPSSIDTSHDIWALGVVFHRLLLGNWPIAADSLATLRRELVEKGDEVCLPHLKDCRAPWPVQGILRVLLSRDPKKRYSASAIARICEKILFENLLEMEDKEIGFFLQHWGDVWVCPYPHCTAVVAPNGSRCPRCGGWVETGDWLPWPWS